VRRPLLILLLLVGPAWAQDLSQRLEKVDRFLEEAGKAGEGAKPPSFEACRKARETLARDPADPPANFEVGQFLCIVKGDWEAGLYFLAKGNDLAIKAAAEKDVASPTEPEPQVEVADGWWDLARKEKSTLRKGRFQERSRVWYERAAARIRGLAKMKVEKRLADLEDAQSGPLNLLRRIDPTMDSLAGDWSLDGGRLLTPTDGAAWARLQIPYLPPAEYDLTVTLKSQAAFHCLRLGLPIGERQCMVVVGGDGGQGTGLEMIDNRSWADKNPTKVAEGGKGPGATVVCSVRTTGVAVTLDGKKIIDWKEPGRLSLFGKWQVTTPGALFVATSSPRFAIDEITLTPVSGAGKRLR